MARLSGVNPARRQAMIRPLALDTYVSSLLTASICSRFFAATFQIESPANGTPFVINLFVIFEFSWTHGFGLGRLLAILANFPSAFRASTGVWPGCVGRRR